VCAGGVFDENCHAEAVSRASPFSEFASDRFTDLHLYVCLGDKHLEKKTEIGQRLLELGGELPAFVHPSSGTAATIRPGSLSPGFVKVGKNTCIDSGSVLMRQDLTPVDNCAATHSVSPAATNRDKRVRPSV
jgi:hypothetical protein